MHVLTCELTILLRVAGVPGTSVNGVHIIGGVHVELAADPEDTAAVAKKLGTAAEVTAAVLVHHETLVTRARPLSPPEGWTDPTVEEALEELRRSVALLPGGWSTGQTHP